jgi:hypothetical protein
MKYFVVFVFMVIGTISAVSLNCSNTNVTLSTPNTIYTLNASCYVNTTSHFPLSAIKIAGNNITLDCNGFEIKGNSADAYATYGVSSQANNTRIINCNISNFSYGVGYLGSSFSTLWNMSIENTTATGYWLQPTCASYGSDQTACTANSCTPSQAAGGCSGSSGNPCYTLSERECSNARDCNWNINYEGCPFCEITGSQCTQFSGDEGACTKSGCQYDRCGICYDGAATSCETYGDETQCTAAGCTWTAGTWSCAGDNSCSAMQQCASFYMVSLTNVIMNKTYSPSGAYGLISSILRNLNLSTAIYNNTMKSAVMSTTYDTNITNARLNSPVTMQLSGGNNTRMENITITSTGNYGLNSNLVHHLTLNNITSTSTSYPIYITNAQNATITNINADGGSYGFWLSVSSGSTIKNYSATGRGGYSFAIGQTTNSTFDNITAGVIGASSVGMLIQVSYDNNISNLRTNTTNLGIYLYSGGRNRLENISTNRSLTYSGIELFATTDNTITNFTSTSTGAAVFFSSSSNNTLTKGTMNGNHSAYGTVMFYSNSNDNTIANSTMNANNQSGFGFQTFSTRNMIINNTITNGNKQIASSSQGYRNVICLNNFSGAGSYVYDLNGTNQYNCTYEGKNQGNIYQNVINGSVDVKGSIYSSIMPLYIGTTGTGVPYKNTTSMGKFICNFTNCQDNYPLTYTYGIGTTNTCSYTGGNWIVELSDNCNITTSYNLGANWIKFNGTGSVTFINATNAINITAKQVLFTNIKTPAKIWIKTRTRLLPIG